MTEFVIKQIAKRAAWSAYRAYGKWPGQREFERTWQLIAGAIMMARVPSERATGEKEE